VSPFFRWWASPAPTVALELAPERVTAVALARRGSPAVTTVASEGLPGGVIVPTLTADNIVDRAVVGEVVKRVLQQAGSPRRVALVVPDAAAKVSIVRFDKVPARPQDLEQMIRWQVKKAVPFPIEGAQVGFATSGDLEGGGREYLVVVMRRDIVESYERLIQAAGTHPGLVDLASLNVVNLVLAGDRAAGQQVSSDWLLVHLVPQTGTLAILRAGHLVFYRNRLSDGQEALVDLVHQTAMYYEDRLGGQGFSRVVLSATTEALRVEPSDVSRILEERLGSRVEVIDPQRAARLDGHAASQDDFVSIAAPLGALLRGAA
jgi:type IV pilus assembly protein PilM